MRLFRGSEPHPDVPHLDMLVGQADLNAERVIAWTRIVVGAVLLVAFLLTLRRISLDDLFMLTARQTAQITLFAFFVSGIFALVLLRAGLFREWMSYALVALDALLIGLALKTTMHNADLSANFFAVSPAAWAIPVMLAVGTLRYKPNVQIFFIVLLIASLAVTAYFEDFQSALSAPPPEIINRFLSARANLARLAFIVIAGMVGVFVMIRARHLLVTAVAETLKRATLTRFLPSEVVPLVSSGRFAELRRGRRQHAVIMFVDIRQSTAMAETMDPHRLSIFLASFRRRVMAAAQMHGGIIDKFIGDGALIVFGLPEPKPHDAARAVAAARDLLSRIARWNAKRHFDPPLAVGIGLHAGEVYFGVIGDTDRMELTVIGDAVNVAARLEKATKDYHVPLLASEAVIREACALSEWRAVGREPLRGRTGEVVLCTLKADAQVAAAPKPQSLPAPSPVAAAAVSST